MLQKELAKRLKARYDTKMDGNEWMDRNRSGASAAACLPDEWKYSLPCTVEALHIFPISKGANRLRSAVGWLLSGI